MINMPNMPNMPNMSTPIIKKQFVKTKLCPFQTKGFCFNGEDCTYAHSEMELRPLPDLRRTKFCDYLKRGSACLRASCPFAHAMKDLKPSTDLVTFKTSLCFFWRKGKCFNGSKCRFAHGTSELRTEDSSEKSLTGVVDESSTELELLDKARRLNTVDSSLYAKRLPEVSLCLDSQRGQHSTPSCFSERNGASLSGNFRELSNYRTDYILPAAGKQHRNVGAASESMVSLLTQQHPPVHSPSNSNNGKSTHCSVTPDIWRSQEVSPISPSTMTGTPNTGGDSLEIGTSPDDGRQLDEMNNAGYKQFLQQLQNVVEQLQRCNVQPGHADAASNEMMMLHNDNSFIASLNASSSDSERYLYPLQAVSSSPYLPDDTCRNLMDNPAQHLDMQTSTMVGANLSNGGMSYAQRQGTEGHPAPTTGPTMRPDISALLSRLPNYPHMVSTVGYPISADLSKDFISRCDLTPQTSVPTTNSTVTTASGNHNLISDNGFANANTQKHLLEARTTTPSPPSSTMALQESATALLLTPQTANVSDFNNSSLFGGAGRDECPHRDHSTSLATHCGASSRASVESMSLFRNSPHARSLSNLVFPDRSKGASDSSTATCSLDEAGKESSLTTGTAQKQQLMCTGCSLSHVGAALVPCGHAKWCLQCADGLEVCPVCGQTVQSRLPISY